MTNDRSTELAWAVCSFVFIVARLPPTRLTHGLGLGLSGLQNPNTRRPPAHRSAVRPQPAQALPSDSPHWPDASLGLAPPGAPMRRPAIFAVLPFCLPRPHAHPTFLPMPQDGDEAIPTTRPHSICWQKAASTSSPKCCAMMLPRPLSKVLFELWRTTETPERWYAPMCWPWMPYACSERPAWQ